MSKLQENVYGNLDINRPKQHEDSYDDQVDEYVDHGMELQR